MPSNFESIADFLPDARPDWHTEKQDKGQSLSTKSGEVDLGHRKDANKLDEVLVERALREVLRKEAETRDASKVPVLPLTAEQSRPNDSLPSLTLTKQIYEMTAPSTVQVYAGAGLAMAAGSGFFVDSGGYLVTSAHVVSGQAPSDISIRTYDRKEYAAKVVKIDVEHDLALLKADIPENEFTTAELANSLPSEGERIFSLGSPQQSEKFNPAGESFTISPGFYLQTATLKESLHGHDPISKINLLSKEELSAYEHYLGQPALVGRVNIDHGSSGGPLFNEKGQVIGVNNSLPSTKDGEESHAEAYFRPLDDIRTFLSSTDQKFVPKTAWKGSPWTDTYLNSFRIHPLELAGTTAIAASSSVLLTDLLPKATSTLPVLSSMTKVAHFSAKAGAVAYGGLAAINDGYNLVHSNGNRDVSRYGLALLADTGIVIGACMSKKVGALPVIASLATRIATEFIPNRQVLDND